MPSSSAKDRPISVWFQKLTNGEIKLPRFQRPQAWDKNRITSLLDTVTQNLPLGVTLLLDVDEEQFVSRYLATAPETGGRVTEHLLDGQQRLTSLWRVLHNNYDWEKYFLYLSKYDGYNSPENKNEVYVFCRTRWINSKGWKMPLWAENPKDTFVRGLIPMELFRPGDISSEMENWVVAAIAQYKPEISVEGYESKLMEWMESKNKLISDIRDVREIITHFNLPYLALPSSTSKETALQVFTNSKPLSQYDIIRAEIEGVKGVSLDDFQKGLNTKYPGISHYWELPFLILATSALIQEKLPNQRGMWDMKKDTMVNNWDTMSLGLSKMALFLEQQGVYDQNRLPTNAVLSVIAALYTYIPEALDARGNADILLKKYLWSSFFTDRYENSAASNAFIDFTTLKNLILGTKKENGSSYTEQDVPVLNRSKHPIADLDELLGVGWPKRENIRARAIMAVFSKLGAKDFADGTVLSRQQLIDGKRHYHHVFPDALIKEAGQESYLALNCALITDKTNFNISNKDPYKYLKERYDWSIEEIVDDRLRSHLIPVAKLKSGDYGGLDAESRKEKIKKDYQAFLERRAAYVKAAISRLIEGYDIVASEIIKSVEDQIQEETQP